MCRFRAVGAVFTNGKYAKGMQTALQKALMLFSVNCIFSNLQNFKINLLFTAPKRDTPVNYTSATDCQMLVRRNDVIRIHSISLLMPTFLNRLAASQSISYPIVLTRLGGPRSRPYPHLKLWKCRESNPHPNGYY